MNTKSSGSLWLESPAHYQRNMHPAFKTHYYAHLKTTETQTGSWLSNGEEIGTVGNTGNAKYTPAHLHYSIGTIFPKWYNDKMNGLSFYTDPVPLLNKYFEKLK